MSQGIDRGRRLAKLRKDRGLIQADAAEAIGIDRSTLAGIERGATLGRHTLSAIAQFYGVTLDYLEHGAGGSSVTETGQFVKDVTELSLLNLWRKLGEDEKQTIASLLAVLVKGATGLNSPKHSSSPLSSLERE